MRFYNAYIQQAEWKASVPRAYRHDVGASHATQIGRYSSGIYDAILTLSVFGFGNGLNGNIHSNNVKTVILQYTDEETSYIELFLNDIQEASASGRLTKMFDMYSEIRELRHCRDVLEEIKKNDPTWISMIEESMKKFK